MNVCLAYAGDLSYPSGGTDRVSALAVGLQERGHDVTVVTPEPGDELPDRLEAVDVHSVNGAVRGASTQFTRAARLTRAAARVAEERDAWLQLEHSTLAGVGALHLRQPFILDMHDLAYARYDHVDNRLAPVLRYGVAAFERLAVHRATHVITVSEFMTSLLRDRWRCRPEKTTVVPNGYFPDRISRFANVETSPGRVCFLGTLHPKVDVETLVEIANLDDVTDCAIIGTGAQQENLERTASTHSTLRVLGRLPDREAFELVAGAQAVVNPQEASVLQRASSPVKLYYYAALGCPMVVSPGPDIVDQLRQEDAAVVADTGTPFVNRVQHLLRDENRAERLGENAAAVATEFTWPRRAEAVSTTYDRLATPDHR